MVNPYQLAKDRLKSKNKGNNSKLDHSEIRDLIIIAMDKKANTITAGVDLGVKTLTTISIFENDNEISRQFLDKKHMGGSKLDWWKNPKTLVIKGKLIEHRALARLRSSSSRASL